MTIIESPGHNESSGTSPTRPNGGLKTAPYPYTPPPQPENDNGAEGAGKNFDDDDVQSSSNGRTKKPNEKVSPGNGRLAERTLFGLLIEADTIPKLVKAKFLPDLIPSKDLIPIYNWAIQQHKSSGEPPTPAMFHATKATGHGGASCADVLLEYDIDIDADLPGETIEWAIETLRARVGNKKTQEILKRMALDMMATPEAEQGTALMEWGQTLIELGESLGGSLSGEVIGIPATEEMRAQRWLWDERLELRTLGLLAGRGGLGKSTLALDIAAKVSRGTLPGYFYGQPKGVVICATEDDWHSVIIPRLEAMGADRSKVWHVKVQTGEGLNEVTLPDDLPGLEKFITDKDAALVILDPLLSRLSSSLDTHKDAEVRRALEPLVKIAVDTKSAVLGIIHQNKSATKDAMLSIMASGAFANVARSTLMCFKHPEDPALRIFCPDKNNHAEAGKGTMTYRTEGVYLGQDTEDGDDLPIHGLKIVWGAPDERTADEIVEALSKGPAKESKVEAAKSWLKVTLNAGGKLKSDVTKAAAKVGISEHSLRRAREEMEEDGELETERLPGKPPKLEWRLVDTQRPV